MKKSEIIYAIFEKLNIQSDDTNVSKEFVSKLIDMKRAMLIKQQYTKTPWTLPSVFEQDVTLALSPEQNIPGLAQGGVYLASDLRLPEAIDLKGKNLPISLRKIGLVGDAINLSTYERFHYVGGSRYTAQLLFGTKDPYNRILLRSENLEFRFLQTVLCRDVYEDPDTITLMNQSDEDADVWDLEYPITQSMADTVVDLITKELGKTEAVPTDDTNNAQDDRG